MDDGVFSCWKHDSKNMDKKWVKTKALTFVYSVSCVTVQLNLIVQSDKSIGNLWNACGIVTRKLPYFEYHANALF